WATPPVSTRSPRGGRARPGRSCRPSSASPSSSGACRRRTWAPRSSRSWQRPRAARPPNHDDPRAPGRARGRATAGGSPMTAPDRADQVGSFLRPAVILAARHDGSTPPARLRELEDHAILESLRHQRELGFEIFTDGELRRSNFMSDFWEAVAGLDHGDAVARMWPGAHAANAARETGL